MKHWKEPPLTVFIVAVFIWLRGKVSSMFVSAWSPYWKCVDIKKIMREKLMETHQLGGKHEQSRQNVKNRLYYRQRYFIEMQTIVIFVLCNKINPHIWSTHPYRGIVSHFSCGKYQSNDATIKSVQKKRNLLWCLEQCEDKGKQLNVHQSCFQLLAWLLDLVVIVSYESYLTFSKKVIMSIMQTVALRQNKHIKKTKHIKYDPVCTSDLQWFDHLSVACHCLIFTTVCSVLQPLRCHPLHPEEICTTLSFCGKGVHHLRTQTKQGVAH